MGTDKCKEKDMKEKFSKEYLQQLRLTLRSKLNERNHKMTVNTWAISIMRYSARIEIEELERKVIGSDSVTVEEARSVEALPDLIREDMSNVEEEVPIVMESFFFFNWDSLYARLNSHCKLWNYKKRSTKKIKGDRKSVQKEPTIRTCLLILDLKPLRL